MMSSSTPSRTTVFPNTPKAYDLVVGHNILQTVPDEVKRLCSKKDGTLGKIVIVTDVLLHKLWGSKLVQAFKKKLGITPPTYVVEVGEASKSRSSKAAIEAWMFQHQCYRDACVVALGGGVVGDLAGFVAATYMRGISVVQVPTSILAMVDSSIGGKTAIDVPYGKNLVGAFHHPKVVIADLKVLDTLPPRQVSNGLAEAIKHAIIRDSKLFEMFETNVDAILAKDPSLLQHIIFESMKIKGAVVTRDEREGGLRAILNIGHTIGHGIEAIMQPTLLHGECVSIGLVKGAEVSRALGLCSSATVGRIVRCLKSYKLPTEMPDVNKYPSCNAKEVIHRMIYDKKNTKGTIKCVLSDKIGSIAMVSGGGFAHIIDPSLLLRILSPGVLVNVDRNIMPSPIKCSSNFSVPGSKSLSNRLLLLAGLSSPNVPCRLRGLLQSDDTDVMMSALESLGLATFEWDNEDLIVSGTGGHFYTSNKNASLNGCHELYMGNAGTATRFIQSVMTLSGRKGTKQNPSGNGVKITGSNRALARPQGPLVEALRAHGCSINYCKKEGHLPIICRESENGLPGGIFTIEGKVSSQFVSSILISAPYANQPMSIVLAEKGRPTSSTYIDMTVSCMKLFGIDVEKVITEEGNVQFNVPNGTYAWCGGKDSICRVECDASSATYPLAFAAVTASEVTVHGVGSSSLQGDAGFAHLLGKMGCEVSMTEVTTTIKGPPLYASGDVGINAVEVDMSDLTDAFMTAVAVAIFAKGTTIITGIANQHVKECDRIAAMCFNLNNIGITARNLKDGIEVDGIGESNWDAEPLPLKSAVIDCYDDHRIAMSFAVVAAAADMLSQGKVIIAIDDKACTAKTYPNFWDDITNGLGLICHGITPPTVAHSNHQNSVDASKKSSAKHWAPAPRRIEARKRSSIVIIGMRAAGKSTMGKALCEKLNQTDGTNSWKFLDLDEVLESRGRSVQQIVEDDGWEGFRQLETEILLNTIDQNKTNTVISCGGGVVETSEARNILKSHWPVLHLKRHIDDIVSHLEPEGKDNGTERRPNYGESIRDVWKRRLPMFNATSTHQFTIIQGDTNWSSIQNEFVSFALTITRTTPIEIGRKHVSPYKSFVCLTLPDLSEAASNGTLSQLCAGGIDGCDAVELRVDLLKSYDTSFVYDQLAILRRALPSSETGIIYTVRTEPEGGRFPIEERAMFELLSIGGRAGCEMVDVESRWSRGHLEHYLKDVTESQPHVAIIASMHAVQQPLSAYNDDEIVHLYEKCGRQFVFDDASLSQAVVCVKMVGKAEQLDASARIHAAARRAWSGAALSLSSLPNLCGLVGICTQKNGSLSRVLNSSLGTTPVTSDLLSEAAAPGQITQQHIKKVRIMLGLPTREDAKRYCLFGTPISTSPSPTMHNTGFLRLGLPHFYDLCETDHLGVVQNVIKSANFGGASVTIPLKEKVIPMMDQLSDSAKAIGAVNTIVKKSDGVLFGDNTDWIGMRDAILNIVKFEKSSLQLVSGAADQRLLSSRSFIPLSGLVVGAGGTARAAIYCLQQMRCPRIVVHNRTHSKALKLAKEFGVEAIESISSNEEKFDVILCTVPSSAQFKMPQNTWENKNSKEETKTGGSETTVQKSTWPRVVLDAAYRPRETSLIRQARLQSRGETLCVEGIDMLIMQGLAQLRRWTNINDLTDIVRDSIQKNVRAYYKQSSA